MICKNCEAIVEGKFCSNCGQNAKVGKINFPNFLNEVSESIFLVNKGFFFTLINLFLRPGQSIKDFINGKRKNHYKPIAYVLILSTVYFLISRIADQNTLIEDLISGFFSYDSEGAAEIPSSLAWFTANYAYTTLILLPIFSLASFVSFLGHKRNLLEHIVLNAYITGQQAIFYSLFMTLETFITNDLLEIIPIVLSLSYTFWTFWVFFSEGNRVINVFRTILTYILYLILSTFILFSIADWMI